MSDYLIYTKLLEERMRATKAKLDDNKQTLLCLAMSLPESLQYLTKIWVMTKDITAEMARNMLLEEDRRAKPDVSVGPYDYAAQQPQKWCKPCKKPHDEKECWRQHPEKAPDWMKEKWDTQRKRKAEDEEEKEKEEASKKKRLTPEEMAAIVKAYIQEYPMEEEALC